MTARALVVAPQPVPWLAAVVAHVAAEGGAATVAAPWHLDLPGSLRGRLPGFLRRRAAHAAVPTRWLPGWPLLEAASALYAGDQADRQWQTRIALRAAVDAVVARGKRWSTLATCDAVVAPSLAARATFAVARARGVRTILVEDYPQLRQLAVDLDAVVAAHPDSKLARRFRPSATMIARQEMEWELADEIVPRRVWDEALARAWAETSQATRAKRAHGANASAAPRRLLLAGAALARNGSHEALALLAAYPHAQLIIRALEQVEPAALRTHPRVSVVVAPGLHDADAVLALSWCETHISEVALAAAAGLPIWATAQAARDLPPGSWHSVEVGAVPNLDASSNPDDFDRSLRVG